jgi:4-amino-4-deoxy-L-arabinose transferase-like glycosyltransferase
MVIHTIVPDNVLPNNIGFQGILWVGEAVMDFLFYNLVVMKLPFQRLFRTNTGWVYTSVGVIGLIGMALLAASTRLGPGIGGDATIYITSARNLVDGIGLGLIDPQGEFRLIPYFPPFYSLVLAFFSVSGLDLIQAASWLNLILFGAIIWLSGIVIYRAVCSPVAGISAALLVAVSPVLMPVYSWAMSEPLAIFLGFGGLVLLWVGIERQLPVKFLTTAGLLCGLAILTRYPAAAFLGAGCVMIFLYSRKKWSARLGQVAFFGIPGMLPIMGWIVFDLQHTEAVSSRRFESAAGMAARLGNIWRPLAEVLELWLIPDSWIADPPYPAILNIVLAGFVLLVVVFASYWVYRRYSKNPEVGKKGLCLLVLVWLFIGAYLIVIAGVYVTTYPPITIGSRMYAPVHVAFLWLVCLLTGMILRVHEVQKEKWRGVLLAGLILFCVWYGIRTIRIIAQNYHTGLGYLSLSWQGSSTIEAVKELPDDTPVVTNEETAVLFLTGRSPYSLAEIYNSEPQQVFSIYGQEMGELDPGQAAFRDRGAALVLFNSINDQFYSIYGDDTDARIAALTEGLYEVYAGEDGVIYLNHDP